MTFWRRLWGREQADLVPRWKLFIQAPPYQGEPVIPPAKVPAVKRLQGVKVDRFEKFRTRHGR